MLRYVNSQLTEALYSSVGDKDGQPRALGCDDSIDLYTSKAPTDDEGVTARVLQMSSDASIFCLMS